jgi:hypothetical protein
MGFDAPATAEGELARTPFAHLLVYAVDQRLTGALFLCEPPTVDGPGVEHVVRFARGTPVKVRPGDSYALLGELLVQGGALSKETLGEALATKGLLGDVLVLAGCVDRDRLEETCEEQFRKRMTRLFTLPADTTFRYCDGHIELLEYGGEPSSSDALAILWAGLKTHGGDPAVVDATLGRLGDVPLRLHPQTTVARLGLTADEARVVEHLRVTAEGLPAIAERGLLPFERLCRLIYALTITRQLDIGASAPPVGAVEVTRSTTFARLQLKPSSHRAGAAAPDVPGDGERGSGPPTGPRRTSAAPLSSPKPRPEPTPTAVPRKASAIDRETLKSAGPFGISERPRPISVEVIDLHKLPDTERAETVPRASTAPPTESTPSTLQEMSASALHALAEARLQERDIPGAEEACTLARRADPDSVETAALGAWIRSQRGGADLKGLTIELDELLGASPDHRYARYYRAMLRKRLGDNVGAVRDLRRLVELSPDDAEAARALKDLEGPPAKPRSGLLGWLFRR